MRTFLGGNYVGTGPSAQVKTFQLDSFLRIIRQYFVSDIFSTNSNRVQKEKGTTCSFAFQALKDFSFPNFH